MQWRWINETVNATDQGNERADGEAETMKDRQAIKHAVGILDVSGGEHLADVGEQVFVREFHAFGHAFPSRW